MSHSGKFDDNVPLAMIEIKKNTAAENQSYTPELHVLGSLGPEGSGFINQHCSRPADSAGQEHQ